MVQINAERFLADLHELRKIGAYKTGVHRPTFSPQDMESRHWLMERLRECGLEASIDGIGNVYGRHKGPGPHLLVGSHIESQNYAGWLDGALGVMAGVALARAGLPVDVAAFADEEGHFEGGFLGSRSMIGDLTEAEIDRSRSRNDGTPLRDALAAGATVTGCTVHVATEELDEGPILAQREVAVEAGDTEESLQERIKQTERLIYPAVIRAVVTAMEAGASPESVSL